MLPRPYRLRISDGRRTTLRESRNQIRDKPILRPIAASDHVTGSRAGNRDAPSGRRWLREKRTAISGGDELCTTFAARIRIVAAHRLVFTVTPQPLPVLIALVTRNDDGSSHGRATTNRFQDVNGAHDVRGIG